MLVKPVKDVTITPQLAIGQLKKDLSAEEFKLISDIVTSDPPGYNRVTIEFKGIQNELLNTIRMALMNMIETFSLTCTYKSFESSDSYIIIDQFIKKIQQVSVNQLLMNELCAATKPSTFQKIDRDAYIRTGTVDFEKIYPDVDLSINVDNTKSPVDRPIYSGDILYNGKPVSLTPYVKIGVLRSGNYLKVGPINPVLSSCWNSRPQYDMFLPVATIGASPSEEVESDESSITYDTLCGCTRNPMYFITRALEIIIENFEIVRDEIAQIDGEPLFNSELIEFHYSNTTQHGDSTIKLKNFPAPHGTLLKKYIYLCGATFFVNGDRTHRTESDFLIVFRHSDPVLLLEKVVSRILEDVGQIQKELPKKIRV